LTDVKLKRILFLYHEGRGESSERESGRHKLYILANCPLTPALLSRTRGFFEKTRSEGPAWIEERRSAAGRFSGQPSGVSTDPHNLVGSNPTVYLEQHVKMLHVMSDEVRAANQDQPVLTETAVDFLTALYRARQLEESDVELFCEMVKKQTATSGGG